ncbi:hypothetical protein HYT74_04310 [Candidatus Daviesbacteria bacterium]|nr:hypothetical protein [Candidatus Daviesbacteria bacterium]
MESAEKPTIKLHEQIGSQLNVTSESISPDNSSLLEGVKELGGEVLGDTTDYMGTTWKETSGQTTDIGVGERITECGRGLKIVGEKANKIRQFFSKKKAA